MKTIEQLMIDSADLMSDFIQLTIFIFRKEDFQLFYRSDEEEQAF